MNNQDRSIIKMQKVLVEMMTIWTLMVINSIFSRSEPNTIGFFVWLGFAVGFYLIVKAFFKSQLKYMHLLLIAIPMFLIAILLGFTPIQSATLSGFLAWRLISHEKDPELESEMYFVSTSALLVLLAYLTAHYGQLPNVNVLVWMLIVQVLFLVIGRLVYNLDLKFGDQVLTKKIQTTLVILLITFGLASIVQLIFPMIRNVFYLVVNSVISVLMFLLSPIFNWAESIEPAEKEGEIEESDWERNQEGQEEYTPLDGEMMITSEHLLIASLIIIAVIIVVLILKNKDQLLSKIQFHKETSDLVLESSRVNEKKLWKRHNTQKAPQNDIRKAFYKLEKWAGQKGVGRYHDESIDEWLIRYELNELIDESAVDIYKNVRYGQYSVEPSQKKRYFKQIDLLKQNLKQHIANEES